MNGQISPPDINVYNKIAENQKKSFLNKLKQNRSNAGDNYDLKYHRLEFIIDPDTSFIAGTVTSYFKTTKSNVSHISFDLSQNMIVDSIIFHGGKINFNLTSSDELVIDLATTLILNSFDSISVFYHGNPDSSGFGSFVKSTHNGTPVIWTLSEPYGAKDWWPCKQGLTDKIDSIDIFITSPGIYKAASIGMLIETTIQGSNKIYHWRHRYPVAAYLIGVAVTNYAVYSNYVKEGTDSIQILNYVYPEDSLAASNSTKDILPAFNFYDSLFGMYPFIQERYGHAQFGAGGGMEHQTMTFIDGFSYEIMIHELSHQWFGDKVTCGSWHDIWLNEGFASYITGLTYERFSSYYWMEWKKSRIQAVTTQPDGAVYVVDTTSVSRIFDTRLSYHKASLLLHMLRWTVGDSCFFAGLRNYINDTALSYKFSTTANFINHIQTSCGKNLTFFFDDWLYNEGYPSYNILCTKEIGNNVKVKISQTQSHPSVSFFEMPVPVKFKNNIKDTIVVFNNVSSGQEFTVNIGFDADSVFYDPERWILSANDTIKLVNNIIEKQNTEIILTPNPAVDFVELTVNQNQHFDKFELYDISGRKIISYSEFPCCQSKYKIDLKNIPEGFYFCRLFINDNSLIKKIEIIR
ncbi:MAG: M1 family aminopeptidase [Bacteroidales bacterium]|nr:M1 family aminopeptidase [Bacteroidales bacterium]